MNQALVMMAALYGLGFANIFLRSTMGVMAPELSRELNFSPATLGGIASAFFVAYALMQIPAGMLLDRFGPRRTVGSLFLLAVAGTALFAVADSAMVMLIARVAMGLGCAAVFAGAFMLIPRYYAPERLTAIGGALNSFSMLGTLCSTAPLAFLIVWLGWRESFAWITLLMVCIAALAIFSVRDFPRGAERRLAGHGDSIRGMLSGSWAVLMTPGILPLASAGVALSAGNTFLGIWGGPYLYDVHGLSEVERGTSLAFMALAGVVGHFLFGHAARWLNTLKWLVVAGCCGICVIMTTMAVLSGVSVTVATAAFACLGLACSFPAILLAHARALVPEDLVGRGMTTVNTGIMVSIALMQLGVGAVIARAHTVLNGDFPEMSYRMAFAFFAAMAFVSTLCYLQVRDRPPRSRNQP